MNNQGAVRNGGKTEVLGAHLYTCVPMGVEKGHIFVEDASFAMAAVPFVMQEGHVRGLVKPGHALTESKLMPETEYLYSVVAFDAANRRSAPLELSVKTSADTEPPSKIADLWSYQTFDTEAQLRLKPTTDNVGVDHYLIQRKEGDKISREIRVEKKDMGAVHTLTDDQVTKGAKYIYHAIAVDAAGNRSEPALLPIEIPTQPPSERILEMEAFDRAVAPPKKAPGHIFGVLAWSGMQYDGVPMGREKAFDRATLRYSANDSQGGTMIDLYLGGELVETAKRWTDVQGGTHIGSFHLASTGGFRQFKEISIPLQNVSPGEHILTLRVRRGKNDKAFNAIGNLDRITLSRFDTQAEHGAALAAHQKALAESDVPEGIAQTQK